MDRFADINKWKMCAKFQQKIFSFKLVGACQTFHFFRQNILFLENNGALPKFFA